MAPLLSAYWVLASLLGAIAVMRYYRRQTQRVGLEGPYLPDGLTGIGIFVGSMLTGSLGGVSGLETLAVVGPPLVISAGLLVFGWLDRSAGQILLALCLAIFTAMLVASDMDLQDAAVLITVMYGAVWLGAGLVYRVLQR